MPRSSCELFYIATVESPGHPKKTYLVRAGTVPTIWEQDRDPDTIALAAMDKGGEVTYCSCATYVGRTKAQGDAILKTIEDTYVRENLVKRRWDVDVDFTHCIRRYME